MFKIKVLKFILIAVLLNILLFSIVYSLPFNPIQAVVAHLISLFVFFFGINLSVIKEGAAYFLATESGILKIYQTFYEMITVVALTIPFYLRSFKELIKKTLITLAIMLAYYTLIYGITVIVLEYGFNGSFLVRFLHFNSESFMIFVFLILWFIVNKEEIKNSVKSW